MSRPAILFFHQSATDDFRNRSGGFTFRQFRQLHQWQTRRTQALWEGLNVPVFDQFVQQGATFGERLHSCLKQIHSLGYDRVLVLGRDCPTLQREDIVKALNLLQEGKACLGPDYRGGTYLMSFPLNAKILQGLASIRWQTTRVLDDLRGLFPQATLLLRRRDINVLSDIYCLKREKAAICEILLRLLSVTVPRPDPALYAYLSSILLQQFYLRPPPSLG